MMMNLFLQELPEEDVEDDDEYRFQDWYSRVFFVMLVYFLICTIIAVILIPVVGSDAAVVIPVVMLCLIIYTLWVFGRRE
jgi:O-antigen/teichoic acid export membrane protein